MENQKKAIIKRKEVELCQEEIVKKVKHIDNLWELKEIIRFIENIQK